MENHWNIREIIDSDHLPDSLVSPIDGAEMVLIPSGEFIRGISEDELYQIYQLDKLETPIFATEVPKRKTFLDAFYIDRYPVTNYQYSKFVEATGHRKPGLFDDPQWNNPMQPVVFVGWEDARAYARWAGKSLPTESQWEKAGRGTDGRWWAWGNEYKLNRCNNSDHQLNRTSDIGLFDEGVSPYGCYDMCGNVWEMCEGKWIDNYLPMRGGCFLGSATFVRITCRWTPEDPVNGADWLGFRCIKHI